MLETGFILIFHSQFVSKLTAFEIFSQFSQHRNVYIFANKQNKHMLWLFIFLVKTKEYFGQPLYTCRLEWMGVQTGPVQCTGGQQCYPMYKIFFIKNLLFIKSVQSYRNFQKPSKENLLNSTFLAIFFSFILSISEIIFSENSEIEIHCFCLLLYAQMIRKIDHAI